MLLASAVDRFLLALEAQGRRPRTLDSHRQRLKGPVRFLEARGIMSIEAVRPEDIDAWVVSLRRQFTRWENHPHISIAEGGLSDVTIAGRIQSVKTMFNFCVERGYVDRSPAAHLCKPKFDQSADGKAMDPDDLAAIIETAKGRIANGHADWMAYRDLALVLFIADTGCRVGEAASLRLSWLRLGDGEATVKGKTGKRLVDYTALTADVLRTWLEEWRPDVDHEHMFVSRQGCPLGERGMYAVFQRLARDAGVEERFNPHSIRHLVGQTWTDEANLELARQKLGHKEVTTTSRFYANQDRARVKAATQRLSLVNRGRERSKHS